MKLDVACTIIPCTTCKLLPSHAFPLITSFLTYNPTNENPRKNMENIERQTLQALLPLLLPYLSPID
jgi:hypothetical protein